MRVGLFQFCPLFGDRSANLRKIEQTLGRAEPASRRKFAGFHPVQGLPQKGAHAQQQDADVVLFVYRDDYYYTREEWERDHPGDSYPPPADIIIAKHRNGPTGEINLRFVPRYSRFENIANEEPSMI